jgi:hypothetical protein
MPKAQVDPLVTKIKRYTRALEAGKRAYKRKDELLEEIVQEMKAREIQELELSANQKATLVDKFAEKNRIGVGQGVNRYEIELNKVADVTAKL